MGMQKNFFKICRKFGTCPQNGSPALA
jgi:hypothetical protein